MAEVIKRVGPPKATDLKGEEFTWTIQLSAAPSREWSRLFSEPAESTVLCHPRRLGMMHQALVFKSDEGHLPTWVQYIDKWIGGANKGMEAQEEAEKQRKAKALTEEEDKQRRPMVLEPWQWSIVKQHPAEFVRGCIESDGCRHRRLVAGRNNPAYSFTNHSEDILLLFMWACGLIDLRPRRANRVTVSIARRADVATPD